MGRRLCKDNYAPQDCIVKHFLPSWPRLYCSLNQKTSTPTLTIGRQTAYLSLRMRRNFLYGCYPAVSSSKLLHQINQLEQVLEAKEASATGRCHKWIFRYHRGPARRNGAQLSRRVVEVDPVLAPVVAIRDQLELLASQGMVRMGYLKVGIGNVTMRCS
jgi:hypothetical protein